MYGFSILFTDLTTNSITVVFSVNGTFLSTTAPGVEPSEYPSTMIDDSALLGTILISVTVKFIGTVAIKPVCPSVLAS